MRLPILTVLALLLPATFAAPPINRHAIVSKFNPVRNTSSPSTPMQIGNGNFAFGVDITGLQTFLPWAILSSWGWKNDSLPVGITQADIEAYRGVSWDNHGREVRYDFGGGNPIEQWLISNPNRVNLGGNVTEDDLQSKGQQLDLWSGVLTSKFELDGEEVVVQTASAQDDNIIGTKVESRLVQQGKLAVFVDFPWNDGSMKFSAPFVGTFADNTTSKHTTTLNTRSKGGIQAEIMHTLDSAMFVTSLGGDKFSVKQDPPSTHRYTLLPDQKSASFSVNIAFGKSSRSSLPSVPSTFNSSTSTWNSYWASSGFVDVMSGSTDPRAQELQRRIILSRYLMRVNEAGDLPPQESGLVNNGWMYFWHCIHWGLWSNWDLLHRSSNVYSDFLASSIARSQIQQGWPAGARWPKMTDPQGRSAPGEINNLLIWEQVHPIIFAEYDPTKESNIAKVENVVKETADWMAVFAWSNMTSGVFDIGPPMYVVSEDTNPNATRNAAFELAYWRLGLKMAEDWMSRLDRPESTTGTWKNVRENLAPLPTDKENMTYIVYEGIEDNFWTDPQYTSDHPSLVGLHGWLPDIEGVDINIANKTMVKVWDSWNATDFWGWDFGMLAMGAARQGLSERAIEWLLDPHFQFDDVGMPLGGVKVPTPYFPGSGSLLLAIAMMAKGWDGSENLGPAPGFPKTGWAVRTEGIASVL
ncbi:Six-hairpin glycosidase-like protein [Cyathus striatus]|nr:Six-hairpin glycosidase-like protein [Cyathus striatus]